VFRKFTLIVERDFRATLRRPFYLLFTVGAPLILAIVAAIIYQVNNQSGGGIGIGNNPAEEEATSPSRVGLVDEVGFLPDSLPDSFAGFILYPDVISAQQATEDGTLGGYYVVPPDYISTGVVDFFTPSANPFETRMEGFVLQRLLVTSMLEEYDQPASGIFDPYEVKVIALAEPEVGELVSDNWFAGNIAMYMVILLYMVILIPAGNLVSSLTDEKKNQVMEVLLCSVSPMQLFLGKLLAAGLLGLLQTAMWVGVLWGVGNLGGRPLGLPEGYSIPTGMLLWGIVFAMLGYLMYGAQLAGVGAIAPNLGESRSVTMLIMSPLIVGYTLSVVITETPYSVLSYILSYFPLTAPVAMIGRMAAVELPIWEPILSAVLQFGAVIVIVRLFGRLFHARLMLSGQPLTIRRFFKVLRER
jgi:ABC-2 type transport system permease protein